MGLFTDTVTVYQKQKSGEMTRTVLRGVQWHDKTEKSLATGRLTVQKTGIVTIPEKLIGQVDLSKFTEEDAILYGEITDEVTAEKGSRLSDLLARHQPGGIIRSVSDNSRRDLLKNIKVVVY